jgi:ComF family protein
MAINDPAETNAPAHTPWAPARAFRTAGRTLLDLLLPPLCLHCQTRIEDHNTLCAKCWRQIDFIRPPLCDRLGMPLPFAEPCDGPIISAAAAASPPDFDRARAVGHFDGPLRDLIHDLKFRDNPSARHLLSQWLLEAGRELLADADALVPIPLNRWRLIQRRFNQAQILADGLCKISNKPIWRGALHRHRNTRHQVGLTALERQKNVAGAFKVPPRARNQLNGKKIILIDDVITTGATVSAAARALKKAGAARVDVLVLALAIAP